MTDLFCLARCATDMVLHQGLATFLYSSAKKHCKVWLGVIFLHQQFPLLFT